MTRKDPFNEVLQELGLYDQIRGMGLIGTAAMPALQNNTPEVPCRIQFRDHTGKLLPITCHTDVPSEFREKFALGLIRFIHPTCKTVTQIRPVSLILDLKDGTVEAETVHVMLARNQSRVYPARYRIPPSTISDLPLQEQVWRAEKFALGTLLYELFAGRRIFEGLPDDVVQSNYRTVTFPAFPPDEEELRFPFNCLFYACWSAEFGHYVALGKFGRYVHSNPTRFVLQAAGGVAIVAALAIPPVLGAVGFGALGPIAGAPAAAWQAAIGAVEAGGLFAWCQGVAMGGAAANGLAAAGAAGGAVAMGATGMPNLRSLRETFIREFRKGPRL